MSHSTQAFGFFPTAPSAPHAFNIFSLSQSPRETHNLYEDLQNAFRSSPEESDDAEFGVISKGLKKSVMTCYYVSTADPGPAVFL
ncbi:hypothetical protein BDW22DRAFT_1480831 [Trametopsis cervina]|nr:hypothetical protein BDW22DRAFT_1480831 [Trametopsis cervina]